MVAVAARVAVATAAAGFIVVGFCAGLPAAVGGSFRFAPDDRGSVVAAVFASALAESGATPSSPLYIPALICACVCAWTRA